MILSACSRTSEPGGTDSKGLKDGEEFVFEKTSFSFDQQRAPYTIFDQYKMAPGDVLDVLFHVSIQQVDNMQFRLAVNQTVSVKFVDMPNLNETQLIRPDGAITLPYLGSVKVVGKTVDELTKELKERYAKILSSPELYVLVPDFWATMREFKEDLHTAPRGLSRLVTVRPDGYATFAMLGDIQVAGRTIPEVTKEMNARYKDIMPELSVDLFLETHSGSLVYVTGEVGKPGSYPIMRYVSVVEALALAGGTKPTAKLTDVVVVRQRGDKMVATKVNVRNTLWMKSGAKYFYLLPDDIVYVPQRTLSRAADISRDLQDVMAFRGWSLSAQYRLDSSK